MISFRDTDPSAAIGFGGNTLDRLSERRDDEPFIRSVRADAAGRALLFVDDDILIAAGDVVAHPRAVAEALGADWDASVFLGLDREGPLFAAFVPPPGEAAGMEKENLRALAMSARVSDPMLGAIAQGRSILSWHARHGFCANCGASTMVGTAGMRRECPSCGTQHFPRTDPVVIMLAVDGERCLLGRQRRYVDGMYSCLAGFLEPGETIEAAVRREIWEEAGVKTGRVTYHASQPWPFPSSLMIGCFAEADTTEIDPRDAELEDVRWFDRADILPMLERVHPTYVAPQSVAIAYHLLRAYAEEGVAVADGSTPLKISA